MRAPPREIDIQIGDKVRKYDPGDWFTEGLITDIDLDAGTVDVDYADWVQRYPVSSIREYWTDDGTYERCLVPTVNGEMIADYRMTEEA
jgi:hypothetical protein